MSRASDSYSRLRFAGQCRHRGRLRSHRGFSTNAQISWRFAAGTTVTWAGETPTFTSYQHQAFYNAAGRHAVRRYSDLSSDNLIGRTPTTSPDAAIRSITSTPLMRSSPVMTTTIISVVCLYMKSVTARRGVQPEHRLSLRHDRPTCRGPVQRPGRRAVSV